MTHIVADFVEDTTITTGNGAKTLAGAINGRRAIGDVCANGDTIDLSIFRLSGAEILEWETGRYTYATSGDTITAAEIYSSSNSNNAVSFGVGTKYVVGGLQARSARNIPVSGHLYGLNGSNAADTDHDVTFTAGAAATESAVPLLMELGSAMTKQADTTWSAGSAAGGMVSGESLPTSGTIHWWLIGKPDGTVDICCNNNATSGLSPTLPAGYTHKRRIRSDRTDSSANILATTQTGDLFLLSATRLDISNSSLGTTAALYALSVPTGIKVQALVRGYVGRAAGAVNLLLTSPSESDQAPGSVTGNYTTYTLAAGATAPFNSQILTDTSAQIRARSSSASTDIAIATYGWIDRRGRDF